MPSYSSRYGSLVLSSHERKSFPSFAGIDRGRQMGNQGSPPRRLYKFQTKRRFRYSCGNGMGKFAEDNVDKISRETKSIIKAGQKRSSQLRPAVRRVFPRSPGSTLHSNTLSSRPMHTIKFTLGSSVLVTSRWRRWIRRSEVSSDLRARNILRRITRNNVVSHPFPSSSLLAAALDTSLRRNN